MKKTILTGVMLCQLAFSFAQDYEWVETFGGTETEVIYGSAIGPDNSIVTTGYFTGTTDLNPEGGDTYTSIGSGDAWVSKLDEDGNFLWGHVFGSTNYMSGNDVSIDSDGNVYVTGTYDGTVDFDPSAAVFNLTSATGTDSYLVKLDSDGNFVWAKSFDYWRPKVTVAASGTSYVSGRYGGTIDLNPNLGISNVTAEGSWDNAFVSLNTDGDFLWGNSTGGTGFIEIKDLNLDSDGNLLATGNYHETVDCDPTAGISTLTTGGGYYNHLILKLSSTGDFIWARATNHSNSVEGEDVIADNDGNVFVSGRFFGTTDFDPGVGVVNLSFVSTGAGQFVQKFNAAGDLIWAKTYESLGMDGFIGMQIGDLATDNEGYLYVLGTMDETADFDFGTGETILASPPGFGTTALYIQKIGLSGDADLEWAVQTGTAVDHALTILVNDDMDIYVSGGFRETVDFDPGDGVEDRTVAGGADAYVLKLSQCQPLLLDVSAYELCEGEELTLEATSELGGTVTWSDGVLNGEAFVPEMTGTLTYTVESDNPGDCPSSVQIEVSEGPTVNPTIGGELYCAGDTIVLGAGGDADSYSWDPLDFTPEVGVTTYTLTGGYDETGCETSETIDVTVNALPIVTASVDNDVICIGASAIFNGAGAETYTWNLGIINGISFVPDAIGLETYTVTGTDINGCENTASVDLTVVDEITISYTSMDEIAGSDGSINITVLGGAPVYTFDWDNDGTGDFDDDEDLTGLTSGFYTVAVNSDAGCSGEATIFVDGQLGTASLENTMLSIYPNPALNSVTLEVGEAFNYEIIAPNGDKILNGTNTTGKEIVEIGSVAKGMYLVVIQTKSELNTIKLLVK